MMKSIHESAPLLEIRDLRLVHAIQRAGGLSRAAQLLHLTQSALSHHLRALEERVGVPLFDREGRTLVLNAQGLKVAQLAERLLPELYTVERSLRSPAEELTRFRITMGCYTVYHWLPMLIARLSVEAPALRCEVVPEVTRGALAALLRGDIDAAVVPNVKPDPRIAIRHAFEEDIVVVMRPEDPLAKSARVSLSELSKRDVYAHETPPEQVAWFRTALGRAAPGLLRAIVRVPLTEAIIDLVRGGAGVAILGAWTVERDVARGELVTRPLQPGVRRVLSVITRCDERGDPRAALLAGVLSSMPGVIQPQRRAPRAARSSGPSQRRGGSAR
ncbi:MAG TPA: LysR family transcriptional regulator [Polyangiales bacterium]